MTHYCRVPLYMHFVVSHLDSLLLTFHRRLTNVSLTLFMICHGQALWSAKRRKLGLATLRLAQAFVVSTCHRVSFDHWVHIRDSLLVQACLGSGR